MDIFDLSGFFVCFTLFVYKMFCIMLILFYCSNYKTVDGDTQCHCYFGLRVPWAANHSRDAFVGIDLEGPSTGRGTHVVMPMHCATRLSGTLESVKRLSSGL